jgi:hypothetical protein
VDKDERTQESDERRGTTGTKPKQADATTQAVERKRKEAEARRAAMGKRKHGETPTPKWARRDMEIEVGNQKPDGLILDTEEKMIYNIEGARCSDTYEAMETAEVTKIHKYRAMREELPGIPSEAAELYNRDTGNHSRTQMEM